METKKDWKYYIDSRFTYLVIGLALAGFVLETGTAQKLIDKLWKKAE